MAGRSGWEEWLGGVVGRSGWGEVGRSGWEEWLGGVAGRSGWEKRLGGVTGRSGWDKWIQADMIFRRTPFKFYRIILVSEFRAAGNLIKLMIVTTNNSSLLPHTSRKERKWVGMQYLG